MISDIVSINFCHDVKYIKSDASLKRLWKYYITVNTAITINYIITYNNMTCDREISLGIIILFKK